jgi:heme A synthase
MAAQTQKRITAMFTTIDFIGAAALAWLSSRGDFNDPRDPDTLALHTRQDLRLISYLLMGVIIMLGIVAD